MTFDAAEKHQSQIPALQLLVALPGRSRNKASLPAL